jgi:FkbM family methyltransferase
MAGKIWRYDSYDLRKYQPGDINYFVDIGANIGSTSLMAKILNPTARVVAFEPSPEIYKRLEQNMWQWKKAGIECYNIAIGDGKDMCLIAGKHSGMHRMCTGEEKQWWPDEQIMIPSKTLKSIFEDYKIPTSDTFILKMDCEGGERFLLSEQQEEEALDIVRQSVQTMFEIHIPFGGTGEQWNLWFKKVSDTHELRIKIKDGKEDAFRYRYLPIEDFAYNRGNHEIELMNKKWIGPYPGKWK